MRIRIPSLIIAACILALPIGCGNQAPPQAQDQGSPSPLPDPVGGSGPGPTPRPEATPGTTPTPPPESAPDAAPPDPTPDDPLPQAECEPDTFCIVPIAMGDGKVSDAYEQELTVEGGSGVGITWKIVEGSLPDGLSLDGKNGTPSWGDFVLTGDVDIAAETLSAGDLTEISGIAASRLNPGTLWVIDDSGGGPDLFAIDEDGAVLQKYSISNAVNHDWEDIAIGPGPDPDKEYVYIGDVGDNGSSRGSYQIVRLEEPAVPASRQDPIPVAAETFSFTYPDGPKNCEAMLIDWETAIVYLIQKTAGVGKVYAFPTPMDAAWDAAHPVTLLPVSAAGMVSGQVTGADASRDSERIIVRQYSALWEYARPSDAPFDAIFDQTPSAVDVGDATDQQYEAICYSSDGRDMVTVTEKAGSSSVPLYKSQAVPSASTSVISGTPTTGGTFDFTVQAKDSANNLATRDFQIAVAP